MGSSYVHLFWGYAAIWLLIGLFVLGAMRDQRKNRAELHSLQNDLTVLKNELRAGKSGGKRSADENRAHEK